MITTGYCRDQNSETGFVTQRVCHGTANKRQRRISPSLFSFSPLCTIYSPRSFWPYNQPGGIPHSGCFCFFERSVVSVQVIVRDNNVDQALKALKKKMQREGIFREMKLRRHFEKPSEKKAREGAEAIRRARKLERKRIEREGF
tara:strand:- start:99 stop:530 length:432 start_codon:yes stop_codon:yes gene_type:complete